jgi:hypothetical protein
LEHNLASLSFTCNSCSERLVGLCIYRFEDWRSEQSVSSENIVVPRQNDVSVFSSLKDRVVRVFAFLGNLWRSETSNRPMLDERKSTTKILHPQGPFLQKWNKIFVISCIFAVSVDPLFFYIPIINDEEPCWYLDRKLKITASVLRSFTDIFYILHIIFQFRTGFVSSSPTASGRNVLIEDRYEITKRYLSTYFLIDVFAVIPLPQVLCVTNTCSQGLCVDCSLSFAVAVRSSEIKLPPSTLGRKIFPLRLSNNCIGFQKQTGPRPKPACVQFFYFFSFLGDPVPQCIFVSFGFLIY